MSGQPISSLETYWFFNNVTKKVQFHKHFIIITDNIVSCSLCKTDLPISVIKTESFKEELALFLHHIRDEKHLQNVLNCIVNRLSPSIWDIDNQYKVIKNNVLYCLFCDTPVLNIVDIQQAFKGLKIHVYGKKHKQQLKNRRMLSSKQQKNVKATAVDYTQNQSKASASGTTSVPSILCSVCETQIEIFNQDILLSQDLHKQSEQHSNACKRKLRKIFAKYEEGNHKNLLTELFQIYPELFDQLEHCELFKDIVYYFLCNVCGKPISNNVPSINDEIYKHLSSSKECESKYLGKIFGEFLSNQNDIETRVTEKKDPNNIYSDTILELFQSLPPHLKSNECVISTVGNLLYCTVCSCHINTCANKSKTLRNLKLHLETIHFENLLNKVFAQLPKKLQVSKQFMYYKDNFIKCSLCNIAGLTYSPVKFKETATSITGHLKGKQHQNSLEKWLSTTKSNIPPSINKIPLTETTDTFKGHIDNLIGHLLPHKQELATLLKKNSKFLRIHCMDFMCILCEKKIGDVQKIKEACNTIVMHFQSKKHITLMNNTGENVSLWKLVYDCYAPELIRSNERYIQKVGDKFRCTLCSFDISEQKVENVMEQLLKHVSSEQHNLTNVFANWSHSPKCYQ